MKRLRQVREPEVIGEFLRNEFHEPDYNHDREDLERYVLHPDYEDAAENALRRAMLFRRRGHMWRELPRDVAWYEAELEPRDLARTRVFPRAHWSRLSNGTYWINDIVERIRNRQFNGAAEHAIAKIQQLRYRLLTDVSAPSAVLLIGVDDQKPLTILEGNHRLAAAMLASPDLALSRFRVLCGFSQNMEECCWYVTNARNLWRYARNRLANLHDSDADVQRALASVRSNKGAEQPLRAAPSLEVENAHSSIPREVQQ